MEPIYAEAHGSVTVKGEVIEYKVITEETLVPGENGEPEASLFTFSYFRTDTDEKNRPVAFVWNGGPGSSCNATHLMFAGPKRIKLAEGSVMPPAVPPFEVEDNPACLLDVCDLVFYDPAGTGFSRLYDPEKESKYYGTKADAVITVEMITRWLKKYDRWNSPKYLIGESYGCTRASRVVEELNGGAVQTNGTMRSIVLNGVIDIGAIIWSDLSKMILVPKNTEPTVVLLETYAATHWYHEHGDDGAAEFAAEARKFAVNELSVALLKGNTLPAEELAAMAEKLETFTGIDKGFWMSNQLKLENTTQFAGMVLAAKGQQVGIYDSRYTMPKADVSCMLDPAADDPAMGQYSAALTVVANSTMKEWLGLETDRDYIGVNFGAGQRWDYQVPPLVMGAPAPNEVECLVKAQRRNPKLQVLFCTGLYDLCTYPGGNRHMAAHSGLRPEQTTLREYPAGHMCYSNYETIGKMNDDIRELIAKSK